jgi:hypothetical protein
MASICTILTSSVIHLFAVRKDPPPSAAIRPYPRFPSLSINSQKPFRFLRPEDVQQSVPTS